MRIVRAIKLRQEQDFRRLARLQAGAARAVVKAIHGSKGQKKGVERADKLELVAPEDTVPSVEELAEQITPRSETDRVVAMWGPPAWGTQERE